MEDQVSTDITSSFKSGSNKEAARANFRLETALGMNVEPADVYLMPGVDDGYAWSALPAQTHLFTKHLSKHSIGAYMELCREVGKSFEAVRNLGHGTVDSQEAFLPEGSFAGEIAKLKADNARMTEERHHWQDQAQQAAAAKINVEEALRTVQEMLEESQAHVQKLKV